jgi:hypothetical protein
VNDQVPIVIAAQGMVSSLGLRADVACAAARAGLRRAQPLDSLRLASLDGRTVEPAIGHPVPFVTHGFEGAARLVQLAAGALRDLKSRCTIPSGASAGFYLSLPSRSRHLTGVELVPDPAAKEVFQERIADSEPFTEDPSRAENILSLALQQAGLAKNSSLRFAAFSGHTGFAEALAAAVSDIQQNQITIAIVGAIDSLVDEQSLKWLKLTGRLKAEANPAGLEPGEAAVFFIVATELALPRDIVPLSLVGTVATAQENQSQIMGRQPTGSALSACIDAAVSESADLFVISDHNGESVRASELGNVIARLSNPNRRLSPPLLPAISFGDTGAASGGLALCLAQSAFSRGNAQSNSMVIASTADGSQRSAFSVARLQKG